jgi:hypothetical protein
MGESLKFQVSSFKPNGTWHDLNVSRALPSPRRGRQKLAQQFIAGYAISQSKSPLQRNRLAQQRRGRTNGLKTKWANDFQIHQTKESSRQSNRFEEMTTNSSIPNLPLIKILPPKTLSECTHTLPV